MLDENQQNTQNTDTSSPASVIDSSVVEMPLEAPESPTNVVDTPPNKDDNGASIQAESPIQEPIKTEETPITPVKSSNFSSNEQTAQMAGNDPIVSRSFIQNLLEKAKLAIQSRKRKKLDHIMSLFAKQSNPSQIKSQFDGASITNNDVQKLLYVSDATATRYLGILIKEGKIKQEGKTGKSVFYILVK